MWIMADRQSADWHRVRGRVLMWASSWISIAESSVTGERDALHIVREQYPSCDTFRASSKPRKRKPR